MCVLVLYRVHHTSPSGHGDLSLYSRWTRSLKSVAHRQYKGQTWSSPVVPTNWCLCRSGNPGKPCTYLTQRAPRRRQVFSGHWGRLVYFMYMNTRWFNSACIHRTCTSQSLVRHRYCLFLDCFSDCHYSLCVHILHGIQSIWVHIKRVSIIFSMQYFSFHCHYGSFYDTSTANAGVVFFSF